jgi:hypothetical protein
MCQYEDSGDGGCAPQLNAELEQAQIEILSAHCATHQLKLRYSSEQLARFGRRDVLQRSAKAASDLSTFYTDIEKRLHLAEQARTPLLTETQIVDAVGWLAAYLQQQREHYHALSSPLFLQHRARLWPYFSPQMLEEVRMVELRGVRIAPPAFFQQARALGFEPPEITHMDSLTFIDVLVFNQELDQRSLFHALVHTVQIRILGLRRYAELWVRSFIKTRAHFTVPLEVHAFSLASKFVRPMAEKFSVEEQVVRWAAEGRYQARSE